ncbi:hypothetical protein WJX74_009963 [Apatococcus lobatus]|uniref:Uncharacterized protein n=1 Tax=Apatococcus lobatus TaxID=904363 RepID=A0AAW1SFR0_9CHLO
MLQTSQSSPGAPNLHQPWALLRLRRRLPQTETDDEDRWQALVAPSLQRRKPSDPAKPQNPDSAFEVSSGLGRPVRKLGRPGTGGKVFGLQDAIPIGHLAEVVNSTVKQHLPDRSYTAIDLRALEKWTQEMDPLQLHLMSPVFQKAIAQWASVYPYLLHAKLEDVSPFDPTSWLSRALQTIRLQYPYFPHPVSVGVQVLLWQAEEELGNLFEPDAAPAILNAVITEEARRVAAHMRQGLEAPPAVAAPAPAAAPPAELFDFDADIDEELAAALSSFREDLLDPSEDPLQTAADDLQADTAHQVGPALGSGSAPPELPPGHAASTSAPVSSMTPLSSSTTALAWPYVTPTMGLAWPAQEAAQPHGRLVTSGVPGSAGGFWGFGSSLTTPPVPSVTTGLRMAPPSAAVHDMIDDTVAGVWDDVASADGTDSKHDS